MAYIFEVKVVPQSGPFRVQKNKQNKIVCYLKSAPEDGAANRELVKELSKLLGIAQMDLEIISGLTMRNKRLKIHTAYSDEQFFKALGLSQQITLPFSF